MGKPVVIPILTATKRCLRCGETKSSDMFGADNRATDRRKSECKPCRNEMEKQRRLTWTDEQKEKHAKRTNKYYRESLRSKATHLTSSAKIRAQNRGMQFEISADFIHASLIVGHCWATGLPFRYPDGNAKNTTPFSPSIDRRNTQLGYTNENVQVVCSIYNLGKNHHDEIDFIAMCMAVAERNKNNEAAKQRLKELRSL
ncbi:postulated decoy of host sigma factor protein [Rhizobium phage RHph_X2_24]|nr:postulated decoy of host sigma factor protein [Rhizobium phage RHph_X2_24]